ncbi:MAG: hypothetical protein KJ600_00815 [Nanoarchaeota archaeon]|nr:hypothetical protein [Nanoarchaeota archaeon]MBU1103084.1 hypothetical protein [Nanoarchaeota archaeon]
MVHLVGVHHGMHVQSLGFRTSNHPTTSSRGFQLTLLRLPKGTRVGIEALQPEDWEEVKEDLEEIAWDNYEALSGEAGIDYRPSYSDEPNQYWEDLASMCQRISLKPVFLEDKATWLRYNRAVIRAQLLAARIHKRILFHPKGESESDYHRKLCRCNEAQHKAELRARKIHEIDRDNKLLEAMAREGVPIAAVGLGHSDFWFGDQEGTLERKGIKLDAYSTDLMTHEQEGHPEMTFTQNATCNPELTFEREGLERALRLMDTGRIVHGRTPDYVGVWDWVFPSKGYFEVFVGETDGDNVSGQIHDCLGVASFSGRITPQEADFTKRYSALALPQAAIGDVRFTAKRVGDDFYGRFRLDGGCSFFYMTKSPQEKPLDLAVRLERAWETDREYLKPDQQ